MNAPAKKVQIFSIKLNEDEVSEIVSMLMEFPGGRIYNIVRNMEIQTTEQRSIPEDKKDYKIIPNFQGTPLQKKEG